MDEALPVWVRMRALRRDSYRCQRRVSKYELCLRRTSFVVCVDPEGFANRTSMIDAVDFYVTDCGTHESFTA